MANESSSDERPIVVNTERPSHTGKFIAIFVILGLLVIGEIYSMSRLGGVESDVLSRQAELANQLNHNMAAKFQAMANANAQSLQQMQDAVNDVTSKMGITERRALAGSRYASSLARKFARQDKVDTEALQMEMAEKADLSKLNDTNHDIATAKYGLNQTSGKVDTLAKDLGMARSSMGTLIATNQRDISALQKLGMRDYYEFDVRKNQKQTVAGITLNLKKANERNHYYNMLLVFSDMNVYKKNLVIDSPFFFMPKYMHQFYEMVVYQIGPHWVKGYISTPKGALNQMAASGGSPASSN
jgi:hypothetical protein